MKRPQRCNESNERVFINPPLLFPVRKGCEFSYEPIGLHAVARERNAKLHAWRCPMWGSGRDRRISHLAEQHVEPEVGQALALALLAQGPAVALKLSRRGLALA
jgi:hypothetical protein